MKTVSSGASRDTPPASSDSADPGTLDEPTVALDPQVRRRIWALVKDMAKGGVTVFLTTHYIEEAEALCDRVAILSKGHLIDLDTPANLRQKTNLPNLEEVFLALTAEDGAAGKGGRV